MNRRGRYNNNPYRQSGLLLLLFQVIQFGVNNIPPVTLSLLVGQVAVFLSVNTRSKALNFDLPRINDVCIRSDLVYQYWDWRRVVLSPFYHGDDFHLYYNMVSLIYKGSMLERRLGTGYFAALVGIFTALTSLTYVGLGFALGAILDDRSYVTQCAVGFSGVLFALKVLTTYFTPNGTQYALGFIPVPSKYIFWAELVLIQFLVPRASFTGHLAGILVGLLYTKGFLKDILDSIFHQGGRRHQEQGSQGSWSPFDFWSGSSRPGPRFTSRSSHNYQQDTPREPSAPPYDTSHEETFPAHSGTTTDPYHLRSRRLQYFDSHPRR